MADSGITRKALASALVKLMQIKPFQKISVAEICSLCDMNRKSFYYHFQDKYDLLNRIFDAQLQDRMKNCQYGNDWELLLKISYCIYENRKFYANALSVHGQNSLNEHIRELAQPVIYARLRENLPGDRITAFHVNYFTDALLAAFYRWVQEAECMPPEEFLEMLKTCMLISGKGVQEA